MPTKLVEWLIGGCAFACLWLALVYDLVPVDLTPMGRHVTYFLPLYAAGLFALASFFIIVYRLLTFADCPEAHAELAKEVQTAKADLAKRGFVFAATSATAPAAAASAGTASNAAKAAKATKSGGKRS